MNVDEEEQLAREVGVPFDRSEYLMTVLTRAVNDLYSQASRHHEEQLEQMREFNVELQKQNELLSSIIRGGAIIVTLAICSVALFRRLFA